LRCARLCTLQQSRHSWSGEQGVVLGLERGQLLAPDIGALGPDATQVTPAEFRALITKGTIAVKARLLDQSKIAGVGNLLADEILWQARVSPLARVDSLSSAQVNRLYRALKSVLESAIAKGGAHTGEIIAARHPGGTCPRDGAPMVHGTVGGRSTWWCSREQALRPDQRSPAPAHHGLHEGLKRAARA